MAAMAQTNHPQETVVQGSKRQQQNPPILTIGVGGMIVATMTDMEEVAGIVAIELVIKS